MRLLQRRGLPRLQADGLARSRRLRHGAPERAAQRWHRCRALHGICVRHGHGPSHDAALRRERHPSLLRKRPALPAAVRLSLEPHMRISLQWLSEWIGGPLPAPKDLAARLTMAGLEIEGIEAAAPPLPGVIVAEILERVPHPNADTLGVCQVNTGNGTVQIVCGAPNARAGMKAPLATVGAELPGGMKIKQAKLRGVDSMGMLC